ncbi:MAG: hypothetical protein HKN79_12375, partial [Flavobacteriales bacterium]|nr:hypothetical protein [Flavobacteriales bacterium]
CSSCCDGFVEVTISGCVAPYSFTWIGPNGFTSDQMNLGGLCPDVYTLFVAESNGNEIQLNAEVFESSEVSFVSEDWICNGQLQFDGQLTYIDLDGGDIDSGTACMTPPYCWEEPVSYEWLDGMGSLISTGSCVEELLEGDYSANMSSPTGSITFDFTLEGNGGDSTLYAQGCQPWDVNPPVITVCPPDTSVIVNSDCESIVWDYSDQVMAVDDSTAVDDLIITQSPVAGTNFFGTQTISISVQDEQGNLSTCVFVVEAIDETAPLISLCPGDTLVSLNASGSYVLEDFTSEVLVTDNCTATGNILVSQDPLPGTNLPASTDPVLVTLTAIDASGLTSTCAFELTVGGGCTDPVACNYLPSAIIEDGSCCYSSCGCTDPLAENFDPEALCEDSSCQYLIQGTVYHDVDENGILDGADYGLAGEVVILEPLGIMAISNQDGVYHFSSVGAGDYILTVESNTVFPFHITPQSVSTAVGAGSASMVDFGLSDEEPLFEVDMHFYPPGQGYACDVFRSHYICFQNLGNLSFDGLIEFQFDSLFQGYSEVTPIDSASAHSIWFSFEDLLPNEQRCYQVLLLTPTVDLIGEFLFSSATIWGLNGTDTVAYGEEAIEVELTCAYDPNDKQVFPQGYSEMHYIQNDTVLEYLIRFQNTGNAPATDVRIIDTLDVNLDLSTFELVANSHSVNTTIDPQSREVDFYFENIMLPDSVNNEPESHGLVSFKIRPQMELPLLTQLNNTAHIFFDNNPPIVTNTTWSTIYDCSLFQVSFSQDGAQLTASEGDSYQWFLNGEAISGATTQEYMALESGEYSVQVGIDFPCMDASSSVFIVVNSLSEFSDGPLLLFPNPMKDRARLMLPDLHQFYSAEILDLLGRSIRLVQVEAHAPSLTIDRQDLGRGQYLLRLIGVDGPRELMFTVE